MSVPVPARRERGLTAFRRWGGAADSGRECSCGTAPIAPDDGRAGFDLQYRARDGRNSHRAGKRTSSASGTTPESTPMRTTTRPIRWHWPVGPPRISAASRNESSSSINSMRLCAIESSCMRVSLPDRNHFCMEWHTACRSERRDEEGGWSMEVGGWRMEVKPLRRRAAHRCMVAMAGDRFGFPDRRLCPIGRCRGGVAAWDGWNDGPSLRSFVRSAIRQAARGATPIVLAVLREPQAFALWDAFYDATVSNHVANRASRGTRSSVSQYEPPSVRHAGVDSGERHCSPSGRLATCPPFSGWWRGRLGISAASALGPVLFLIARGLVSAAVRLGVVGPMEGQRLQVAKHASRRRAPACPEIFAGADRADGVLRRSLQGAGPAVLTVVSKLVP